MPRYAAVPVEVWIRAAWGDGPGWILRDWRCTSLELAAAPEMSQAQIVRF
jgi:hypothetical protein